LDVLELLSKLVSFYTVNDPNRGEMPSKDCPEFIHGMLKSWNIDSEIIEDNGAYAVYGEIGSGFPKVMVMAHFDVVPVNREEWNYDPFSLTLDGEKAFGRGSVDDKGNVTALLLALQELKNKTLNGKVLFAFTGDEETGGAMASFLADKLSSDGKLPTYLINADGTGMVPIVRRRKGFGVTISIPERKINVRGSLTEKTFEINTPVVETRHAAYFLPGVDTHPLIAVSQFLRETDLNASSLSGSFLKSNVIPGKVTLQLGKNEPESSKEVEIDINLTRLLKSIIPLVRAPIKPEKYSDFGVSITPNMYSFDGHIHSLYLDIRAMSYGIEDIERTLREVLSYNLPDAEVSFGNKDKAGFLFTDPGEPFVKTVLDILQENGEVAKAVEGAGAADCRYFTPLGVKAIDFGPKGGNVHGPNEYVEIPSLQKLPHIYVQIIENLLAL
jgi:succinyl-diaminopimelate desuccinylase